MLYTKVVLSLGPRCVDEGTDLEAFRVPSQSERNMETPHTIQIAATIKENTLFWFMKLLYAVMILYRLWWRHLAGLEGGLLSCPDKRRTHKCAANNS